MHNITKHPTPIIGELMEPADPLRKLRESYAAVRKIHLRLSRELWEQGELTDAEFEDALRPRPMDSRIRGHRED